MMKALLLLRHAKSSWKHPELVDHDRPLNKRGKRDALRMGRLLEEENLIPDAILSSTAVRAQETAARVAKSCGYDGQITILKPLYMSGPEEYIEILHGLPDDLSLVLLVGHNPGIQEYLEILTKQLQAMPTATLALVNLPIKRWSTLDYETEGRLVTVWKPKDL
jgi:phosphohistidine phosphatase